ncbi:MAG: hypothetical protein FH759_02125 [Sediminimonas qiaohouensis]|uniref:Uncharacterized protein n=1 Tax=Sediminimonas qiaohouensis TaxID=552061 RepID=A0A7C9LLI8_9RHOB|nr:hypothetical protein [Sediminimonas qiaohouensis]MTJ03480.1 hypothetical protein [Sediminimonas qiaohouensis]
MVAPIKRATLDFRAPMPRQVMAAALPLLLSALLIFDSDPRIDPMVNFNPRFKQYTHDVQ